MSDSQRDERGRFLRDPRDGARPFDDWRPKERNRDARSGRPQRAAPGQLSLRVPLRLMNLMRTEALRRDITITKLVLSALEKELQPVTHDEKPLVDSVPGAAPLIGQNRKLERLAERLPSPVNQKTPEHDHVGKWRDRKTRRSIGGHLVDRR